jgi:hypothetical protein
MTPWNRSFLRVNSRLGVQISSHGFRTVILLLIPVLTHIDSAHNLFSHFLKSILVLSSHPNLGLPSCSFFSRFPTENLHVSSPIRATRPAYLSSLIWSPLYYLVKNTNYILNERLYMKESWVGYCET